MDKYGSGEDIVLEKVFNTVGCIPSFRHLNQELFTGMCVLAGCDFLPPVPGIGIAKAYNLVDKYRNIDRVLSVLKIEKGKVMPEDYSTTFKEAFAVFQHARVYDAVSKKLKPLKPFPSELLQGQNGDLDFLGPDLSPSVAVAIAEGNLDPTTMEAFDRLPQPGYPTTMEAFDRLPQPGFSYDLHFPDSSTQVLRQEETTDHFSDDCTGTDTADHEHEFSHDQFSHRWFSHLFLNPWRIWLWPRRKTRIRHFHYSPLRTIDYKSNIGSASPASQSKTTRRIGESYR